MNQLRAPNVFTAANVIPQTALSRTQYTQFTKTTAANAETSVAVQNQKKKFGATCRDASSVTNHRAVIQRGTAGGASPVENQFTKNTSIRSSQYNARTALLRARAGGSRAPVKKNATNNIFY